MLRTRVVVVWLLVLFSWSVSAGAQSTEPDTRTEFPKFLADSYFSILFGSINYPFSDAQLQPGYRVGSVEVPHTAVQVVLFGHHFNKYFSGELSYLRPIDYVHYTDINGDKQEHSVSVAVGQIVVRSQYPITSKVSLAGEGGVTVKTRRGFEINKAIIVDDEHVASWLVGAGLEYHANYRWDLVGGLTYSPAHPRHTEPETVFGSLGFRYNMRPKPGSVPAPPDPRYIFPEHIVQFGYSEGGSGYRVNSFFSEKFPIFWGGDVKLQRGIHARYQQNVYHTRKVFSLDFGASAGFWSSREGSDKFFTLSAYPLLRFTVYRRPSADYYFSYSFAGPTLITKSVIGNQNVGTLFTFQDMFAVGAFLRKQRNLIAELGIGHYSNGNLFTDNPGLKVPLTFTIGYTF